MALLRDRLLASSVNGGGVFLVDGAEVRRLSEIDTTAIAPVPDGFLWARQAEGLAELRYVRAPAVERVLLTSESLDLHDVLRHGERLYIVATQSNTVLELDAGSFAELRRWTQPGEPDSQHLNSICVHGGRLLASRFGRFDTHRGYKGRTRGAGEVFDLETGEVLISGLSQPHTLRSFDGLLWLCDSEAHAVHAYRDYVLEHEVAMGGYARGLAFGAHHIYVGLSRSRNAPDGGLGSARIVPLSREDLVPGDAVCLPANEIYDLALTTDSAGSLRDAALAESLEEVATLRHQRNLAAAATGEAHAETVRIAGLLHQANLGAAGHAAHMASLRQELGSVEARLAAMALRREEDSIWSASLQAEVARLQHARDQAAGIIRELLAHADAQAREMATQAAGSLLQARALSAAEDAIEQRERWMDAVLASRSWRWTRALRRSESPRPPAVERPALEPPAVSPSTARQDVPAVAAALAMLGALDAPAGEPAPCRRDIPILGLELPVHDDPQVTIVVTASGDFDRAAACLQSIASSGDPTPAEVVLVDDSGLEEMLRFAHVPGLRFQPADASAGAGHPVNAALASARGEYVHVLDSCSEVRPGWLAALLQAFALLPGCGLAGARLLQADGTLVEDGAVLWADGALTPLGRGEPAAAHARTAAREVDVVSRAVLAPTTVWRAIGGFDARYRPGRDADCDLAFRVRRAGLRVCLQPSAAVLVHGIVPPELQEPALPTGEWTEALGREQLPRGAHFFLARDRSQLNKCVLVVDHYPPQPDRDAGSRAIWQLLRVLCTHGFKVKFWAHREGDDPGYADALRAHGIEVFGAGVDDTAFEDWIATHGRYFDYVVASRPLVARDVLGPLRRHSGAVVLFYGHDIHHLRIARNHAITGDPALLAQSVAVREMEERIWRDSDVVLYPSAEETAEVRTATHDADRPVRAITVPLFASDRPLAPVAAEELAARGDILFVGSFVHAPNVDAVTWFAVEAWPRIMAARPGIRLVLVGGAPPPEVRALAGPGIVVAGQVSEEVLVQHYRAARVVVAPLRFGAGVKGKIVESMFHGVPCVTTSVGKQGLQDADFLAAADDAEGMAAKVVELLDDEAAWLERSRRAQEYAQRCFSPGALWATLAGVMDSTAHADVQTRLRELEACAGHAAGAAAGSL